MLIVSVFHGKGDIGPWDYHILIKPVKIKPLDPLSYNLEDFLAEDFSHVLIDFLEEH